MYWNKCINDTQKAIYYFGWWIFVIHQSPWQKVSFGHCPSSRRESCHCNISTPHTGTKRSKLLQQSLFSCCVACLQAVKVPKHKRLPIKSDILLDSARGFIRNEKHSVELLLQPVGELVMCD